MTVCAATPRALSTGARPVLLAVLSYMGLAGCLGDTGELFPALSVAPPVETSSAESTPAGDPAPAGGLAPDAPGVVDPDVVGPDAVDPDAAAGLEQPASPVSLDPASPETPSGGESPSQPVAAGEPPNIAPPTEAPPSAPPPPATEGDVTPASRVCGAVADPLLLDFASPGESRAQAVFGDFEAVLSGGTYVYPEAPGAALLEAQPPGLISDVTAGDWHITGSVLQQSGFGLFLDCELLDASRFAGIAFRVSGTVESGGSITLLVGTASNEVSRAWLLENDGASPLTSGRCTPAENAYDGTCNQARVEIRVARGAREVFVPFSELGNGSPDPGVNPAEITTIGWALPSPTTGPAGRVEPYGVDLRIDDIRFIEGPEQP